MTQARVLELMERRSDGAQELVAAIAERPMLAVGLAMLSTDEFLTIAIRAKRVITERAQRAGVIGNFKEGQ